MLKKTIPILSVIAAVVMLFIAAKALTNLQEQKIPETAVTKIDIDSLKQQVITFISQNKQLEAQAAIDKLYLDFAQDPKIDGAVYDIAESYRNSSKFGQSLAFYKDVVTKWPASEQAMWAQRGIAISDIALGKLTDAQAELEKLKAGFSTEPNIAEAVFNVADAYYWFGKFKEADGVYKYVVDNYPKSDFGMWAQMGVAISSIAEANEVAAEDAVEGLIDNYKDNIKLPEALYYIGTKYGYDRKYEKAEGIYQAIIDGWSESEWAKNAKFENAKIGVFKYLDKNDEPNTLSAIDNLVADFNDRPDLAAVVFDMGARSDWQGKYEPNDLTTNLYDKVIENFPTTSQAQMAKISNLRLDALYYISTADDANAIMITDTIIADYNTSDFNKQATEALWAIGQKYYNNAWAKRRDVNEASAADDFRKSIFVKNRILEDMPAGELTPVVYFNTAVIYGQELKEYTDGASYLKNVVTNWPGWENMDYTYLLLGRYYTNLKRTLIIPEQEADAKTEQAYKSVIEQYPNSEAVQSAVIEIGDFYVSKGLWEQAVFYFEAGLQKSRQRGDKQREAVLVYKLGEAYEGMGKAEKTVQLYSDFVKTADANDLGTKMINTRLAALQGGPALRSFNEGGKK